MGDNRSFVVRLSDALTPGRIFGTTGKAFRKLRKGTDSCEDRWADQAGVMSDEPEYQLIAREKDRIHDGWRRLAADRGKMAVALTAALAASVGFNIYQGNRRQVQDNWFAYDANTGEYQAVKTVRTPSVPDVVMQREARRVLECTFSTSFDPNTNFACKKYVGQILEGQEAVTRVRGWYESVKNDGKSRIVTVKSLTQTAGNMTWQFRLKLDTAANGTLESVHHVVGQLSFNWKQPTFNVFDLDKAGPRIVAFNYSFEESGQ